MADLKNRFYKHLREKNIWWSPERLDYSLEQLFLGVNLSNHSVLEVGAGPGYFSIWCVANGASKVVALEPEASGSSGGVRKDFAAISEAIKLGRKVEYLDKSLEEYIRDKKAGEFDYILMHAVINHLDESATECLHLPTAESERERYRKIFRDVFGLLNPNGLLLIYDVARRNFWGDFRLQRFFTANIQFHKHQHPKVWTKLLRETGFDFVDSIWFTPFRLRKVRWILSSAWASYFIDSAFILRVRKPRGK